MKMIGSIAQAIIIQLHGINKSLNIIASEVKADRKLKQSINNRLEKLEHGLKEIKDDPFGIK